MKSNSCSQSKKAKWPTILLVIVVGSLLLAGCGGQAAPKVYRVGILSAAATFNPVVEGFKAEMTGLGYVEGENIIYDLQIAEAESKQVVQKFVEDKVDLIFAFPTERAMVAKAATQGTDIPVLFSVAGLEGNNLVNSVREPGGNITGVRFPGADLSLKSFEILLELVPDMKQLYIAYNPNYPSAPIVLEALRPVVSDQGVTLVEIPVKTAQELEADLQARAVSDDVGIDAILIIPENVTQSPGGWAVLSKFAAEHSIPVAGLTPQVIQQERGAVFCYGINMRKMGELAAPMADKILKGTTAGTIPVVSPEAYLRISAKRVEELGLTMPEALSLQAVEIIR